MINKVVRDSYDWFVDLVAERRNMSRAQTLLLADGSIFSGSQGLANKLIDAVGDEKTAKSWLIKQKGLDKDIKIYRWKPDREEDGLFANPAGLVWLVEQFGIKITPSAANSISSRLQDQLFLDGLVSMWLNPSGRN